MKKVLFIAVATMFSTVMFAQTTATTATVANPQTKADMKDLRTDIKDKRQDKEQRAADLKSGNTVAAKDMTKAVKTENRDIKTDKSEAKADGVKHPIRRADRQIHRARH